MGVCGSKSNQELVPKQAGKSAKASNPQSVTAQPQQTSLQCVSIRNVLKIESQQLINVNRRPDPSPVRSMKKIIPVQQASLSQAYSILKPKQVSKKTLPYTLVQNNKTGQIRKLTHLKREEKNVAYVKWLISADLSNPHITQIVEILKEKKSLYVIEEMCSDGQLSQVIDQGPIQEDIASIIIQQILEITKYLHNQKLIHGRLKMNSFSLQNTSYDFFVKLTDIRNLYMKEPLSLSTLPYQNPERIASQGKVEVLSKEDDLWAVGIISYQLLTGQLPYSDFKNLNLAELKESIIEQYKAIRYDNLHLSECSKQFLSLILKQQPSLEEIMSSRFILNSQKPNRKFLKALYNLSQAKPVTYFLQCILIYMIEQYDKESQLQIEGLFQQANQLKNGVLSRREISSLYKRVYNKTNISEEVERVFKNLDTDQSDGISLQEFMIGTIDKEKLSQPEFLEETFKKLSSQNGHMTVKSILRHVEGSEEALKKDFEEMGVEKIKKDQFKQIMEELVL